jgi:iron complex transport system permease protein
MRLNSIYSLFSAMLLCSALCILAWGEVPFSTVIEGMIQRWQHGTIAWNPLLDERLPRLIVILSSGAALAVSGAVMQSLFHNPLASPSGLGISSGGSLLVVLVFVMDWEYTHPYTVPLAAVIGCFATLLFVYALSTHLGALHLPTLILTGIAISTLLIAIQGGILYALRDRWQLIQLLTEWEAGSTMDRTWAHVHMQLPLTLIGLAGCLHYRRELDILALGQEEAANLGVEVDRVRWHLFLCVAMLTGGALAGVGIIAFYGLVLPHLIRRLTGSSHLHLIPLCIIGGSAVLAGMDLTLRIFRFQLFSIGNVSAIIGGLFFLCLMFDKRMRRYAL